MRHSLSHPVPRALAITYRKRDGSIPEPNSLMVATSAHANDWDDSWAVRATYRVENGPTFAHEGRYSRADFLPHEWRSLEFSVLRKSIEDIRRQVREHNAAILPVDNGPDVLVYLAETGTRVRQAWDPHPRERIDMAELRDACRANSYAADLAVEHFRTLSPHHHPHHKGA